MTDGNATPSCTSGSADPETVRRGESHAPRSRRAGGAVDEPGLGSSADGKRENGIDRSFERTGAPVYLGQDKSPLERREQSRSEVVGVDVGRECPVGLKRSESIADCGGPLIEPSRDERASLGVTLCELTNERAELAAPF